LSCCVLRAKSKRCERREDEWSRPSACTGHAVSRQTLFDRAVEQPRRVNARRKQYTAASHRLCAVFILRVAVALRVDYRGEKQAEPRFVMSHH
jgi:hypothetical protein